MLRKFRKNSQILLSIILFSAVILKPVHAQQTEPEDRIEILHAYLEKAYRNQRIPGMAIAVVEGERIIYRQGFGTAAHGEDITSETPFFIGSLSKAITATAVMQLVDAGQVDIDQPIQAYLPWFATADAALSRLVTVKHLLNQTSGLTRANQGPLRLPRNASIEAAVRKLADQKPTYTPGMTFSYFNPNYTALGVLVESISGMTYQDYVREHIFRPLEMKHSFTSTDEAEQFGLSEGYSSLFSIPIGREQIVLAYDLPAGFIISSANDMANFLIAHMNNGRFGNETILSPDSIKVMQQPAAEINSTYAMGWEEDWVDDTRIIAHSGSLQTFYSMAVMIPESRYGFVILINQNGLLNMMIYEKLIDNIVRILTGSSTKFILSLGFIYAGAALLFLLDVLRHIIAIKRIPAWLSQIPPTDIKKRKKRIFLELLILILITSLMAGGLIFFMGRQFARVILFNYLPELSIWLAMSILFSLIKAIMKQRLIAKY